MGSIGGCVIDSRAVAIGSSEVGDALSMVFGDFQASHGIPAVSFGVVEAGELVQSGAFGWADVERRVPVANDTIFRIASMTKSMTACCLLMLRDDRLVRLDDLVEEYLPALRGRDLVSKDSPRPTVRHLLTMSGGLVEDDPWADRQLAMSLASFDELLQSPIHFNRAPGIAFEYSNLGYAMLGRIVEIASGKPLPQFAQERLFGPLDMTSTTFEVGEVSSGRRAHGYRASAEGWAPEEALHHGAFGAMGGVWTTVPDFAKYVAFHLSAWPPRDGPDLSPMCRSSRREMQQPQRVVHDDKSTGPDLGGLGYGMGLMGAHHRRLGQVVSHSGGLPGFGSHVEWLPDCGVGVVAFANLTYAPMRMVVRLAFEKLEEMGCLSARLDAASGDLRRGQALVGTLYRSWDGRLLAEGAADNLFLDRDLETRARDFADLRAAFGQCTEVGPLRVEGHLRATWTMSCQRGQVGCRLWLSPTNPPRIQVLSLEGLGVKSPTKGL